MKPTITLCFLLSAFALRGQIGLTHLDPAWVGILVATPPPAAGPITFVQEAYALSTTISFNANVSAGNLIVVALTTTGTTPVATVTDGLGNTYTLITNRADGASSHVTSVWYAKNIAGGACTVTLGASSRCSIIEITNCSTTVPLDVYNAKNNSTSVTTLDAGSITTAGAAYMVMVGRAASAETFSSITSGWGQLRVDAAAPNSRMLVITNTATIAGTHGPTATYGTAASQASVIAAFK